MNDARVMLVLIVAAVLFGMLLAIAGSRRP